MSAWWFYTYNIHLCVGKDNFLFTFFAARMNTCKETCAFQVMKEDVNEDRTWDKNAVARQHCLR